MNSVLSDFNCISFSRDILECKEQGGSLILRTNASALRMVECVPRYYCDELGFFFCEYILVLDDSEDTVAFVSQQDDHRDFRVNEFGVILWRDFHPVIKRKTSLLETENMIKNNVKLRIGNI